MAMIEVNNLTGWKINEGFLKKIGEYIFKKEAKKDFKLSIALVGQKRMKELNKKYRAKNVPTDVLSFSYDDSGEIILCLQKIKENGRKFKSSFRKELTRVLIHGIIHLFGYDHGRGNKEALKMKKKENYYLSKFFKLK